MYLSCHVFNLIYFFIYCVDKSGKDGKTGFDDDTTSVMSLESSTMVSYCYKWTMITCQIYTTSVQMYLSSNHCKSKNHSFTIVLC